MIMFKCFTRPTQWPVYTFLLVLLCAQDQILEHQVRSGINQMFASLKTSWVVLFQLPSWWGVSVAKVPPYPDVRNDAGGGWGREDAAASTTEKALPSPSPPGNRSVLGLLPCMFEWGITACSAELTRVFKACLGLFWKTWMQLSQISTQICSFGLACNELNFILPVLHSQLATQNLNSFNNSPNHPIRLIIKA